MEYNNTLPLDINPTPENKSIIKIIGVGGGGQNAAAHMYNTGITDVTYLVINSDEQALRDCAIQDQLQIGPDGLGCGAKPELGKEYAIESEEQIKVKLNDGTKMAFITAGMGGGTGTGASPEVARIAKEMGILTVGIVTIPFKFEGRRKILKAYEGISRIKPYCDALLIVNNMKLIKLYKEDTMEVAFKKADDVLAVAAKSISDIITKPAYMNVDFHDVEATLANGGVALISTGTGRGENRMQDAINEAITSPLLQNNNIGDSKHLLFELCMSHEHSANMDELDKLNDFVDGFSNKDDIEVIWGALYDDDLGEEVRIIILASGFAYNADDGTVISGKVAANSPAAPAAPVVAPAAPTQAEPAAAVEPAQPQPVVAAEPAKPEPAKPGDDKPEATKTEAPATVTPAAAKTTPVEEPKSKEEAPVVEKTAPAEKTVPAEKPAPAPTPAPAPAPVVTPTPAPAPAQPKVVIEVEPVQEPAPIVEDIHEDIFTELYGEDEAIREAIKNSRKNHLIFSSDELKNIAIADELENTPSYKRKAEDLTRIKNKKVQVQIQGSLF